eukprot:474568-Pelagomonas_calceolata.AAC.2
MQRTAHEMSRAQMQTRKRKSRTKENSVESAVLQQVSQTDSQSAGRLKAVGASLSLTPEKPIHLKSRRYKSIEGRRPQHTILICTKKNH